MSIKSVEEFKKKLPLNIREGDSHRKFIDCGDNIHVIYVKDYPRVNQSYESVMTYEEALILFNTLYQ